MSGAASEPGLNFEKGEARQSILIMLHEKIGLCKPEVKKIGCVWSFLLLEDFKIIGVRAGGARGAAAPPNYEQLRFFGQQEKIWAKPVFKNISMLLYYFEEINIFYFNLKLA